MSDKPLWVRWFPADFRGSGRVAQMTRDEEYLYRVLLDYQATDGALPTDPTKLARLAKMTPDECAVAWGAIRDCFEEGEDGKWRNGRMHSERERVFAAQADAVANGRRGAERRWAGHKPRHGDPNRVANGDPNGAKMASREPRAESRDRELPAAPPPVADAPAHAVSVDVLAPDKPARARKPRTDDHGVLIEWWSRIWAEYRGGAEWAFQGKDFAAFKKLREIARDDVAEIQARGERMLRSVDNFIIKAACPTLLLSKWNELGVDALHNGTVHVTTNDLNVARSEAALDRTLGPNGTFDEQAYFGIMATPKKAAPKTVNGQVTRRLGT